MFPEVSLPIGLSLSDDTQNRGQRSGCDEYDIDTGIPRAIGLSLLVSPHLTTHNTRVRLVEQESTSSKVEETD